MIQNTEPRARLVVCSPILVPGPGADLEKLPPELVTAILEFLDPRDLRRAAAVSKLFYEAAWSAGHSLTARIYCNRLFSRSQPAILNDVVQHALRNSRRLSLTLTLTAFDDTHWTSFDSIVASLTASLPTLVYLSVSVCTHAVPTVVSALCQPAPYLQEFVFLIEQPVGPCQFDVPAVIFGGVAPKLRRLVLNRLHFGQGFVPAFAQVTALEMQYRFQLTDVNYAEHFPSLLRLHLAFRTPIGPVTIESIKLSGLRLHSLVIEDYDHCTIIPATVRSIDVSSIPVFKHIGSRLHRDDPLWKQDVPGAVSIRLTRHIVRDSDVSLLVVPTHRRWRRRYHIKARTRGDPCPIAELPDLFRVGQRVVYLRVGDEHLVALLEAGWPDLAALRALWVDYHRRGTLAPVLWPPPRRMARDQEASAPGQRRYLPCSALETLTISACDAMVTLASGDVALIGSALAQSERGAQERATLVLVGIILKEPVEDALLQETFSSIRSCGSPGASTRDRDGDLWDEED